MRGQTTFRVFATIAMLLLAGCSAEHGPRMLRAGAPALGSERNLADPNAPFTIPAGKPQLRTREPLLDVTDVGQCSQPQLLLFESRAQSNGDHHTLEYTIQNRGEGCRLGGFPAVSLLRADGSVAGTVRLEKVSSQRMAATLTPAPAAGSAVAQEASAVDEAPSPQVLLPARGSAAFELGWTTGPGCEQVSRIAIAAPGSTRPVVLPRPLVVCENRILITAVAPSGGGRP